MAVQKEAAGQSQAAQVTGAIQKKKREYDPTDNKGRGYRYVWEVYPDSGWNEKWGRKPLLGYVRADSEFHAVYAAYDKGLAIKNATFGLEIKKATKFVRDI